MILEHSNYRTYLKSVIAEKQRKSPGFSMRAFARQIGLGQSAVSQVLAGKKNLSLDSAAKIAQKLRLNETEAEYFRLLVQIETTKNHELKKSFLTRAQSLNTNRDIRDLSVDFFASIADWYHIVIENLLDVKNFSFNASEISKLLGITRIEAETAIERLLRLEIIERDPNNQTKYCRVKDYIITKSQVPNQALRTFHQNMLEKAIESLETQSPQEKFIGTETFAISQKMLPEISKLADEFLQNIAKICEASDNKTDVYHLGLQFFNLTKGNK